MAPNSDLYDRISATLPAGCRFHIQHVSTPPNLTCALYTPPPGTSPEKTFCESHLLLVSHEPQEATDHGATAIFAIEALIYTTAHLTTIFIAKADSTGFAASLPSTASSSTLRTLVSTLVSHLIRHRHRNDRRLVLTLFARAQDQYLFPGSVENNSKHVLTDRQLVKWWCRALDPVLREYQSEQDEHREHTRSSDPRSKAHLIVPGYDARETTSFFPPTAREGSGSSDFWNHADPLRDIAPYNPLTTAPRSLIPHFPDDPKSRFLLDLDEEITDAPNSQSSQQQPSPSKRGAGMWKSVKSIEQFWEMMAWRQECSSGRLVGFLWITFTPQRLVGMPSAESHDNDGVPASPSLRPAKRKREADQQVGNEEQKPTKKPKTSRKRGQRLQGIVIPRQPRAKTAAASFSAMPERSKHYYWPSSSRGQLVVGEKAYQRVHEILLRLDFAGIQTARASTAKWVSEVAVIAGRKANEDWGVKVVGKAEVTAGDRNLSNNNEANVLNPTAVRKKKSGGNEGSKDPGIVNDLGASLIRKKPKQAQDTPGTSNVSTSVNTLGEGLIRKKVKA